jgi:dTDP-4-amino-4,6-dideoxygalactose transaminase
MPRTKLTSRTRRSGRRPGLAVLGAPPMFPERVHVGRPNLGDRRAFLSRVADILNRRWLSNDGPLVKELEARLADLVGVKHCVAMCNATIALEIAARALDLHGEVLVPSFTFIATAHALRWQGITPVFVDIDPRTHNIDPAAIERHITARTTGIVGVHLWGRPCDTAALESIAARHNLTHFYDAAHAFACSHGGRMIGGFGACEVFSFHATKFLNSFEGGAVVTNDADLAHRMKLMRNFGFVDYDRVDYVGTNGKMNEICAAMALVSLDALPDFIAINRRNFEAYSRGLHELPGLSLVRYDVAERNNYQYVVVEVDPDVAPLHRDELISVLHAERVLARRYFWPGCHRMEPYRSLPAGTDALLPETERVASRVLVLPTGQGVTLGTVATICKIFRSAFDQAVQIRARLSGR